MRTWLLIAAWTASVGLAFWQFEGRYLLPKHGREADRGAVARLAASARGTTMLVVWDPSCPCSRFEEGYIRRLADEFQPRGVAVRILATTGDAPTTVAAVRREFTERRLPGRLVIDAGGRQARALGVAAAPGAVVLDADGRVRYSGALHAGRFCKDPKLAFAERALEDLLAGRDVATATVPFFGCGLTP